MKKIIIITTLLLTGCATTSDVEGLQTQVDKINQRLDRIDATLRYSISQSEEAEKQAKEASRQARLAINATVEVIRQNDTINQKLDNLFKHTKQK